MLLVLTLLSVLSASAVIDNRFVPVYPRVYRRTECKPSNVFISPVFMTAHQAQLLNGETGPIQTLYRPYNLSAVNASMLQVGIVNPNILTEWYAKADLFFNNISHLRAEGFTFGYEQALGPNFSVGAYGGLLSTVTSLSYRPSEVLRKSMILCHDGSFFLGRELGIEKAFYSVDQLLELKSGEASEIGFTDFEIYLRGAVVREYLFKCRRIDIGGRIGVATATGNTINPKQPASIPFGGNGHVGLFVQQDTEIELKQDIIFGWWIQGMFRFTRLQPQRFIVGAEPLNYGVVLGDANVKPGTTLAVSPYVALLDIQDGFGARAMYTYVKHWRDKITGCCVRPLPQGTALDIGAMEALSQWSNEYITAELFYDLTARPHHRPYAPRFFAQLWIPVNIFASSNVVRTWEVFLGAEFNF